MNKKQFINEVKNSYEDQIGLKLELDDEVMAQLNMMFQKGQTIQYAVDQLDWLLND